MAITYPIDLPLQFVQTITVDEDNASSFSFSPFTYRGDVQEFEGERWKINIGFRAITRAQAQSVQGFVSSLRGNVGTFITVFPGYSAPLGAAATVPSSPRVTSLVEAGSTVLPLQNVPPSTTDWLKEGDILQVGPSNRPHWHRVLTDISTNATGFTNVDVWPRIRQGTIFNDPVEYENPLCLFRMTSKPSTLINPPVIHSIDIEAVEAI